MSFEVEFSDWLGRTWERTDELSERLVAHFSAMLSPYLAPGQAVPLGVFWCLCPDAVTSDLLGNDGHPKLGLIMPEISLPRRMWAGGELMILGDFVCGDRVIKRSTITDLKSKSGKSGKLCFVTIQNEYHARGQLVIQERQDIVYRTPTPPQIREALSKTVSPPPGGWSIEATPTLLFRYSALTFNGHRIHYDYPYATETEGYAGFVVHGPLQATLMLNRAAAHMGHMPRTFTYRGLSPLISGQTFAVVAENSSSARCATKVIASDGTTTMSGEAS